MSVSVQLAPVLDSGFINVPLNPVLEVEGHGNPTIVEVSLRLAGINDPKGFSLKRGEYDSWMDILSLATPGKLIATVKLSLCRFDCCRCDTVRNITFKQTQDGMPIMTLVYKIKKKLLCFGGTENTVEIYIPQSEERIGWIKFEKRFGKGTIAVDCVTKSILHVEGLRPSWFDRYCCCSSYMGIQMVDMTGAPIAVALGVKGISRNGFDRWLEFETQFNPDVSELFPVSTKALILATSFMWIFNYTANLHWKAVRFLLVCFMLAFIFFLIGLFS